MAISISISITQNSQSIANNTSNVTVKVNASWTYGSYNQLQKSGWLTIDGTKYTFTSSFNYNQATSGSQTLFTKTVNVSHNTNGTKTLSCSASYTSGVSSGTVTASASKALTTIPRKSTLTVSNGTLGVQQTLKVTEQASEFTHTITAKCGTESTTVCTKSTSNSINFTPPISWASQNTTGTSVSVTYTITTYSGSTNVGSNTKTVTCSIPADVKPSCSISVSDATTISVSDTTTIYDTYGAFIRNLSKFKVTVTATPAQGSGIKSYKSTANGSTYTSSSFTTGVLSASGTLKVSSTVTDKRGRSGTASKSVTVLDYNAPTITQLTVHRCNEDGSENDQGDSIKVTFSAAVTSLSTAPKTPNTSLYTLKYKKTTEDTYTSVTFDDYANQFSIADASYIFKADTGSSYDVELDVQDRHNTTSRVTTASTAFTIMHWGADGRSLGLGKMAEMPDVLDIGFETRFHGGIIHPVLEPKTDLNDVRTPNTYVGANVTTYEYGNCPLTSGTFTLEVVGMGEEGQVKQRITYCHKTASRTWERIYYSSSWGEWVCVSDFDGALLYSNAWYMAASQTVTLSEPISQQRSGIVLVFCYYNGSESTDYNWQTFFVPKQMITLNTGKTGYNFLLSNSKCGVVGTKYLYISDNQIGGSDYNTETGTGASGIVYSNNKFVLRYVIGV